MLSFKHQFKLLQEPAHCCRHRGLAQARPFEAVQSPVLVLPRVMNAVSAGRDKGGEADRAVRIEIVPGEKIIRKGRPPLARLLASADDPLAALKVSRHG